MRLLRSNVLVNDVPLMMLQRLRYDALCDAMAMGTNDWTIHRLNYRGFNSDVMNKPKKYQWFQRRLAPDVWTWEHTGL